MVANANGIASNQQMTKSATPLARPDMPVIDKDQIAQLVTDLKSGKVDTMNPYSKDVLNAIGGGIQQRQPQPQQQQQQQPQQQMPNAQQNTMQMKPHQQGQQLQAAHTRHQGPSLNEWLVLSGIIKD